MKWVSFLNFILNLSGNMENTLENNSGIFVEKAKFFIFRMLTYFSFLLLPVWWTRTYHLSTGNVALLIGTYSAFLMVQWFFLGKEIDHRFKIYYRVNSSVDRLVYRILLGMFFCVFYFNVLILFPSEWIPFMFWGTWGILGLFYSWPTRGKIIQESVTHNFTEYRFLDRFEKTLLFLIVTLFITSLPNFPDFNSFEAIKLLFDKDETLINPYWNFISISYFPFIHKSALMKIAVSMHYYVVHMGLYLITFYAFGRYFLSRRLALLGIFVILSNWGYYKILENNIGISLISTSSLFWFWAFLWIIKSATYRTGLFAGLIVYYFTLVDRIYFFYGLMFIALLLYFIKQERNFWFRRQFLKYCLFGMVMALSAFLASGTKFRFDLSIFSSNFLQLLEQLIRRKAFLVLTYLGFLVFLVKLIRPNWPLVVKLKLDQQKLIQFSSMLLFWPVLAIFIDQKVLLDFNGIWAITFMSILVLELIFQSIARLRSSRNMIYLTYILIALLDSHFEVRIKSFVKLFELVK